MGACRSVLASCMYACNCCICNCCFSCMMCCKCLFGDHTSDNLDEASFNNELALVFYDKLSKGEKMNPTYSRRYEIFKQIT